MLAANHHVDGDRPNRDEEHPDKNAPCQIGAVGRNDAQKKDDHGKAAGDQDEHGSENE